MLILQANHGIESLPLFHIRTLPSIHRILLEFIIPPGEAPPQAGQRPEETLKHQLVKLTDHTGNNASAELALRRAGVTRVRRSN
jgi:hypothetical protein